MRVQPREESSGLLAAAMSRFRDDLHGKLAWQRDRPEEQFFERLGPRPASPRAPVLQDDVAHGTAAEDSKQHWQAATSHAAAEPAGHNKQPRVASGRLNMVATRVRQAPRPYSAIFSTTHKPGSPMEHKCPNPHAVEQQLRATTDAHLRPAPTAFLTLVTQAANSGGGSSPPREGGPTTTTSARPETAPSSSARRPRSGSPPNIPYDPASPPGQPRPLGRSIAAISSPGSPAAAATPHAAPPSPWSARPLTASQAPAGATLLSSPAVAPRPATAAPGGGGAAQRGSKEALQQELGQIAARTGMSFKALEVDASRPATAPVPVSAVSRPDISRW